MFNLSAIVGSALLYGDFKKATFPQLLNFLYGCGATFAGVFIIAWAPSPPRPTDEDEDEDGTIHTATLPGSRGDPTSSGAATLSEDSAVPSSVRTAKVGSLARRNRAMLVIPDGATSAITSPSLRNRHSIVSLYGFSPAQVSTPDNTLLHRTMSFQLTVALFFFSSSLLCTIVAGPANELLPARRVHPAESARPRPGARCGRFARVVRPPPRGQLARRHRG